VYVENGEELQDAIDEKDTDQLIVFRPVGIDLKEAFKELCSVLCQPPERYQNWALLIDEAAQLQSSQTIVPELSQIIRQHPRSVLIVQTTHSLQDWHRASKDLMNHLYSFRLVGRSLEAVVNFCDGSQEMEDTIKNLPRHHLIHVDFEAEAGSPEFIVMDDPGAWWVHHGKPLTASEQATIKELQPTESEPFDA